MWYGVNKGHPLIPITQGG